MKQLTDLIVADLTESITTAVRTKRVNLKHQDLINLIDLVNASFETLHRTRPYKLFMKSLEKAFEGEKGENGAKTPR